MHVVNPQGGKGIAPCGSYLWSCDYDSCSKGNFSLSMGDVIIHNYQAANLGISSQVTVSATAPLVAAVGAGVGVPFGIAFVAVLALFAFEKRRNRRMLVESESSCNPMTDQQGYLIDQKAHQRWYQRHETPFAARMELNGTDGMRHEMPQSPR